MDDRLRQSETTEIVLRQSGTKTDTEEWPNSSSSHTCPKKVYFYSYEIFWSWSQACSQHIWHANLSVSDDNLGLAVEVQLLKLPMCSSLGQVSSSHYKGGRKGEKKKDPNSERGSWRSQALVVEVGKLKEKRSTGWQRSSPRLEPSFGSLLKAERASAVQYPWSRRCCHSNVLEEAWYADWRCAVGCNLSMVSHENKLKIQPGLWLGMHTGAAVMFVWACALAAQESWEMDPALGNSLLLPWQHRNSPSFHCCPLPWALCHQPSIPSPLLPPVSLRKPFEELWCPSLTWRIFIAPFIPINSSIFHRLSHFF